MLIIYFALCACVGLFAHHHRNRNSFTWGALSVVITPLIGGLVVAILPPHVGARETAVDPVLAYWRHLTQKNAPPTTAVGTLHIRTNWENIVGAILLAVIAGFVLVSIIGIVAVGAEPLPVPRPIGPGGSCPYGYVTSGSFCVPTQGAQDAIPKPPNGTCPWGWASSGSFCLRSGSGR